MALSKSLAIPGSSYAAAYFRIDKVRDLDPLTRNAEFTIGAYSDEASAKGPQPLVFVAGIARFTGPAFDAYFSKSAMASSGRNLYAQIYAALADLTAAQAASSAGAIADPARSGPAIDPATLLTFASLSGMFAGPFLDGATPV